MSLELTVLGVNELNDEKQSWIWFDLMQNAIDSIEHAIDLLAYGDELDQSTKYKRAILSISHAI